MKSTPIALAMWTIHEAGRHDLYVTNSATLIWFYQSADIEHLSNVGPILSYAVMRTALKLNKRRKNNG